MKQAGIPCICLDSQLCGVLQQMAAVQQQLAQSQASNVELQAQEAALQARVSSIQSELASVRGELQQQEQMMGDTRTQLQTVRLCLNLFCLSDCV